MGAIIDALTPRMHGEDLVKLEEFKKLNPPGDLAEGAVMEMTGIRGDTLLYRNSAGTVGAVHSIVFTRYVLCAFAHLTGIFLFWCLAETVL